MSEHTQKNTHSKDTVQNRQNFVICIYIDEKTYLF